jgi:biopolymer transport protein ExbB/TolQ
MLKGPLRYPIYAGALTIVFFLILSSVGKFILPASLIIKLTERGWTPYASIYLTIWSLLILNSKIILIMKQRSLIKKVNYRVKSQSSGDQLQNTIEKIKAGSLHYANTLAGPRIAKALEHFLMSRNVMETGAILNEEHEAALDTMHISYAPIRVFLWTIPILGFIGTVMGVSDAIGEFGNFIKGGQTDITQIKSALTKVTSGLSVAFDTTYVALVLTVFLMIIASAVEKSEREQLDTLDKFCKDLVLLPLTRISSPVPALVSQSGPEVDLLASLVRRIGQLVELQSKLETRLIAVDGKEGLLPALTDLRKLLGQLLPVVEKLANKPIKVDVKFVQAVSTSS